MLNNKKRLLIIEDDVDVAEMLVTFFNSQGYEVFHADMGNDGVTLARQKFPHLILLDLMLPDMTGFDVCRILRTANLTKFTPIFFLTQRDGRSDKLTGFELGADDYVTKPFDIEELRLRVQNAIKRATRDNLHEARTGLPTGPYIRETYNTIQFEDGWNYLTIKVEHFQEFRDQYGFIAADDALDLIGQILRWAVSEYGTVNDFVGTDSEAHFVLFTQADVETLKSQINLAFSENVLSLYNFNDLESNLKPMELKFGEFTVDA